MEQCVSRVARELQQCGLDSSPLPQVKFIFEFVVVSCLAVRVVLLNVWFPSSSKTNISKFQFNLGR